MLFTSAAISAQVLVAVVFLASGIGKLRSPGSVGRAVQALRLPRFLASGFMDRAFPTAEILLALALLGLPLLGELSSPLRRLPALVLALPAIAAALLSAAFTVLVALAVRRGAQASCSCFGGSAAIMSRYTVLRNAALTALALSASLVSLGPRVDWSDAQREGAVPGIVIALVAVVLVVALAAGELQGPTAGAGALAGPRSMGTPAPATPVSVTQSAGSDAEDDDGEDDYIRRPNPAVMLAKIGGGSPTFIPDEATVLTSTLSSRAPVLVLYVSSSCGQCTRVLEREDWIVDALPGVEVIYVMGDDTEEVPDQWRMARLPIYRDLHFAFRDVSLVTAVPALVLLGTDGLMAAGPEYGADAMMDTVKEIAEALSGRPA